VVVAREDPGEERLITAVGREGLRLLQDVAGVAGERGFADGEGPGSTGFGLALVAAAVEVVGRARPRPVSL
jgi:hypothetical protein